MGDTFENIIIIYFNEVLCGDINWFCFAEDVFQWPEVVKVLTEFQVTRK